MGREGFEPSKAEPTDLQSAPFDRSGTSPFFVAQHKPTQGFEPWTPRLQITCSGPAELSWHWLKPIRNGINYTLIRKKRQVPYNKAEKGNITCSVGADGNPPCKKASALRLCRIFYRSEPHPCPLVKHYVCDVSCLSRNSTLKNAQGAGMDTKSYLDIYYAPEVFTKNKPQGMTQAAAQQDIDTQAIKGATDFTELQGDIKALVYVSEKSDFSTFVHESAHVARRTMQGELLQQAERAFGVTDGKWTRSHEEKFAQGFEQYLKEGKAPSAELKSVFQKAAEFLTRIYKSLQELVHINDDIRAVYDELLGVKDGALQRAKQGVQERERAKKAKQNTTGKYASAESYEQNRISETTEDKALENAALKDKYMAYAKEHFQGNSYHNADTDTDIRVSRDILDEWQSKTKSREQILSMQALDKLIESAVQTNTIKDKYAKEDVTHIKYFETGLTVNDNTYKAHLTVKEIQDTDNKAYHYYLEDVTLEDIAIDQIKKEAALRIDASSNEVNVPLLRGTEAALRIDAHSKKADVPLLHGSDTDTIAQQSEAVNGETEQTIQEQAQKAYDTAAEAAQQMRQISDEELKDMLFQAEQTGNREALYFQTEAEFYEESAQAVNKEVLEHDIEKIVIGKDPNEFYSLIYSDSEQRALYDKAFREAISEELEEALQKDIKDEAVKNDTFIKILSGNKEAVKEFLKQFIAAQSMNAQERFMSYDAFIAHGGRFGQLAYEIAQGKAFTEKQYKKALGIIEEDVGTYRNMFARMNGYDALISMSKEEKAWTKAYSEAVFSGKVKDAEQQSSVL